MSALDRLHLTRGEAAYAVFVIAVMVIGGAVWMWAAGIGSDSHTITRQQLVDMSSQTWPKATRTIDGTPVVVQPEDLDR